MIRLDNRFEDPLFLNATESSGLTTLIVGDDGMADSQIAIVDRNGEKQLVATDLVSGVHTLKVTTEAANSSISLALFGNQVVNFATVLTDGVHMLRVEEA